MNKDTSSFRVPFILFCIRNCPYARRLVPSHPSFPPLSFLSDPIVFSLLVDHHARPFALLQSSCILLCFHSMPPSVFVLVPAPVGFCFVLIARILILSIYLIVFLTHNGCLEYCHIFFIMSYLPLIYYFHF